MSENTMAVKLQRLKDLNSAITSMGGAYSPSNNSVKAGTLSALETSLTDLDDQINPLETLLNDKQNDRYSKTYALLEKEGYDGIIKLSRNVAGYVEQMGEEHQDKAELIRRAVNKIAPSKTRRKPLNESDKTRSTSEKAFDSMFAQAKKIAKIITDMGGTYNPADATIAAGTYTANVTALITLSEDIGEAIKDVTPPRKERARLYDGLTKRITLSKNHVKYHFGATSPQYDSVKLI